MHTEYLAVRSRRSVAASIDEIRRAADLYARYSIQYIYALDESGRLEGVVPLRALLLSPPDALVEGLMVRDRCPSRSTIPLDYLYDVFQEKNFLGAPVVDKSGLMLGVVERSAVDDATIDHAEAEHMKSLGIASGEELRSMPSLERSRRRLAWLSINIALNLLAASVIAAYEETLQAAIALAVFLPIISDMSGCSGNQAVAVSLRELSLGVVPTRGALARALERSVRGHPERIGARRSARRRGVPLAGRPDARRRRGTRPRRQHAPRGFDRRHGPAPDQAVRLGIPRLRRGRSSRR